MFLLDALRQENVDKLSPKLQELLSELKALFVKISPDQVNSEGKIEFVQFRGKWGFRMDVQPKDLLVPSLKVEAFNDYCNLYIMDHHENDFESRPDIDVNFKKKILEGVQRYLSGITVLLSYDKNQKLIKKTCYWGLNTEVDKNQRLGTIIFGFWSFRKVREVKKITSCLFSPSTIH